MKKIVTLICVLTAGTLLSITMFAGPQLGKRDVNLRYGQAKVFTEQTNNCIGNLNAKIVIVDFFDYNCPDCRVISKYLTKLVKTNKNIKVVFVDYPKLGPTSTFAAKACLAAIQQNKYPELHDAIINAKRHLTHKEVYAIAKEQGLDVTKLKRAIKAKKVGTLLLNNLVTGTQLNIKYVPTILMAKLDAPNKAPKKASLILMNTYKETQVAIQKEIKELNTTKTKTAKTELKNIKLTKDQANLFLENSNSFIGNKDGKIVIVDLYDYNCSDCKFISHYLDQLVKTNENIKAVFVDYPLLGNSSTMAAKAALASKLQGKYMPFHNALIAAKAHRLSATQIYDLAKSVGLDVTKLKTDMKSQKVESELLSNILVAKQFKLPFVPIVMMAKLQKNANTNKFEAPKTAMVVLTDSHLEVKQAIQNEVNQLNAD
jgi:protein-disulfide isomerase